MPRIALKTHGLTKKYGETFALDSVSLTLGEGEVYGLVGRNGAGKTTFFKCIMGLAKPTAGRIEIAGSTEMDGCIETASNIEMDGNIETADRIEIDGNIEMDGNIETGRESKSLGAARQRMGFMINPSFFPYLNPTENLEYLCRVKGIKIKGEVERLLGLVGLAGVKKPFKEFSLGMKQRLGVAGALLGSPPIVVLDEPVNGLDPQGIVDMREMIKDIHTQTGTTFIISSHILSELDLVATQFGFIEKGVLVKEISHADLHELTKKSLVIEVGDAAAALAALRPLGFESKAAGRSAVQEGAAEAESGSAVQEGAAEAESRSAVQEDAAETGSGKAALHYITVNGNQLVLRSGIERPNLIARALIEGGVEVYDLHRQETTLEEYFMRLVGSPDG